MFNTLKNASAARKTGGFTLVELLVAIAIIGVLAAIAVPVFLNQDDSANTAAAEAEASALETLIAAGISLNGTVTTITDDTTITVPNVGSMTVTDGTMTVSGADGTDYCALVTVGTSTVAYGPGANATNTGCAPSAPAELVPTLISDFNAVLAANGLEAYSITDIGTAKTDGATHILYNGTGDTDSSTRSLTWSASTPVLYLFNKGGTTVEHMYIAEGTYSWINQGSTPEGGAYYLGAYGPSCSDCQVMIWNLSGDPTGSATILPL